MGRQRCSTVRKGRKGSCSRALCRGRRRAGTRRSRRHGAVALVRSVACVHGRADRCGGARASGGRGVDEEREHDTWRIEIIPEFEFCNSSTSSNTFWYQNNFNFYENFCGAWGR